jgi:hypothetical protein
LVGRAADSGASAKLCSLMEQEGYDKRKEEQWIERAWN